MKNLKKGNHPLFANLRTAQLTEWLTDWQKAWMHTAKLRWDTH